MVVDLPKRHPGLSRGEIDSNAKAYIRARIPTDRYASFDYCFNHFQSHRESDRVLALADGVGMQLSCLHLGFYLASWGMLRGSTELLRRSVKYLAPVVEVIARVPAEVWGIDANNYSDEVCASLLDVRTRIRAAFPHAPSDILVTKIMLGVFGSVPAFDRNFKNGSGLSTFSRGALRRLGQFYEANAKVIDRHRIATLDFDTGGSTDRLYTRAKVIDMIFFEEGRRA